MTKNKQDTTATRRKFLGRSRRRRRGDHRHAAGLARADRHPEDAERLRPDRHPQRLRPGLCRQGQRDGRRPPEDRLPQFRRRGEAVLGDGRDVGRRARWKLERAGLLVRQAPRRLAVRHRSRLRHQRRPVHELVLLRRRRRALSRADAGHPQAQRRRLLLVRHADTAARLVQESRSTGRKTSRA